jgi:hypothetical protein
MREHCGQRAIATIIIVLLATFRILATLKAIGRASVLWNGSGNVKLMHWASTNVKGGMACSWYLDEFDATKIRALA